MKIIYGDLIKMALEEHFDVIIHGCNSFCNMGAGIARTIRYTFPKAYDADCATKRGDKEKLGTITTAIDGHLTIVNGYTQHTYGGGLQVDYDALRQVFKIVKERFGDKRIGYPLIGAGLAGGDWKIISLIIEEELQGCDHTLVIIEKEIYDNILKEELV